MPVQQSTANRCSLDEYGNYLLLAYRVVRHHCVVLLFSKKYGIYRTAHSIHAHVFRTAVRGCIVSDSAGSNIRRYRGNRGGLYFNDGISSRPIKIRQVATEAEKFGGHRARQFSY